MNPLLDVGLKSDADLAEGLGSFFADVLRQEPERFLQALLKRPVNEQLHLAWMAGVEDGGGMPGDTLQAVRVSLKRIVARNHDPLAKVARRCLAEIEKANKDEK
ncbi:MAG: hypothetical protein HY231_11805 [Acidobacteria bacterium]|nr:hypothetical protein [Acidobacteriota bacterium]